MPIFIEPDEHPVAIGWAGFDARWYTVPGQIMRANNKTLSKLLKVKP